jgi:hypothetical protein
LTGVLCAPSRTAIVITTGIVIMAGTGIVSTAPTIGIITIAAIIITADLVTAAADTQRGSRFA